MYTWSPYSPTIGQGSDCEFTTIAIQLQVHELGECQDSDSQLAAMKKYLVLGELPLDEHRAVENLY